MLHVLVGWVDGYGPALAAVVAAPFVWVRALIRRLRRDEWVEGHKLLK